MSKLSFIFYLPFSLRQKRLSDSRRPMTREEFISQLGKSALGHQAAAMLWGKLNERIYFERFTPYPTDDLGKIFGIAEEDLDERTVLDILKRLRCPIPGADVLERVGPINTSEDLVRLIEVSAETSPGK